MKRNIFITTALIAFALSSCNNSGDKKTGLVKVSVRQEWFPNANFAGEVYAMNETDSLNGLDVVVEAGSDNIDPIKLVLSGKNDFGVVGADKVLIANEKGANLVVIGVLNYNSPTVFISKQNSGITTPNQFEGKKVGILTGTATEYVYRSLVSIAKIDKLKLKEIEAPFDLATFINGEYDVRPAFAYDEPVSLDLQNIKYNIIKPEDYGVEFLGTVYFTTKKMITEKPEIVQKFIKSMTEGWAGAIQNPEKSINYLKAYDKTIDVNRENKSLKMAIPYFKGHTSRLLYSDLQHWNNMANTMVSLGLLKKNDVISSIDTSFVK